MLPAPDCDLRFFLPMGGERAVFIRIPYNNKNVKMIITRISVHTLNRAPTFSAGVAVRGK